MNHQHQKPTPSRSRRVLIVEDGARFREMLTRAIREMDFEPHPVDSAESAIKLLGKEPVEIAMVDLGLPGMPGLELCHYLRNHYPAVQIIILTGYGDLHAAKQAIRLDVVDFLTKPCDHKELEVALDRALRKIQHNDNKDPDPSRWTPEDIASSNYTGDTDVHNAHQLTIEQLERQHIQDAIKRNNGNRAMAAKELGISVRTLYYRLSRYKVLDGIDIDR